MKLFLLLFLSTLVFADPPIKIAYVGGLTGAHSIASRKALNVLKMITKKYNAQGGIQGRKIEVTAFDTQNSAPGAVSAMNEIKKGNYLAMIGVHSSNDGLILSKLAEENKIPLVVVSATHPDITKRKKYVVRTCYNDDAQGAFLAELTTKKLRFKRIAIVTDVRDSFTNYLSEVFQKKVKANGAKILANYAIKTNDKDFNEIVKNIANLDHPDSIFLATSAMEAVYLMTQLSANNVHLPLIGSDGWQNDDLLLALKTLNNSPTKAYFSAHWYKELPSAASKKFLKQYKKENKEDLLSTDIDAVLMHDSAELLYQALTRAESSGAAKIMEKIKSTSFAGVTGKIKFSNRNEMTKDIFVLKLANGKLTPVSGESR